jgi:hypothetical protein
VPCRVLKIRLDIQSKSSFYQVILFLGEQLQQKLYFQFSLQQEFFLAAKIKAHSSLPRPYNNKDRQEL